MSVSPDVASLRHDASPVVVDDKIGVLRRAMVFVTGFAITTVLTIVVILAPDGALTLSPSLYFPVSLIIAIGFATLGIGMALFTAGYDQYRLAVTESGITCKSLLESRTYGWNDILAPMPDIVYRRVGLKVTPREVDGRLRDHERFSPAQWLAIMASPSCPETLKTGLSPQVRTFIHGNQKAAR